MKKILALFTLCFSILIFGQEYLAELPENLGPNKCYAKCIVPDGYKDETIPLMIKPAYDRFKVIPAEYKNEN